MKQWNPVRILMPTLIFIIALTAPIYASSIQRTPEVESALNWLKGQFEPSTALPQSYESLTDAAAWTYDVATWLIVMTQADEIESAQKVVQTMLQLQSNGAWVDGYSIINRSSITETQSVGPNAWMGLALCHYFQSTQDREALEGALRVADWLLGLQNVVPEQSRSDGAIPGGRDESGAQIQWISVEHNTDALAFFYALNRLTGVQKYSDAAQRIADWLVGQMWNPAESHFEVGTVDIIGTVNTTFPERLDTQTWTILGIDATKTLTRLDAKDFNGLPWIDRYQTTVQYQGKTVKGFAIKTFGPGSESFWSEGTAGYGLAAMTLGDNETASFYSDQIHLLQTPNGGIPHSVAPDEVPREFPQKWDFNSIAATTWMIWLDSGINPFTVAQVERSDPPGNGENRMTTHLLIVTGTVYEADGKTVVSEKLSVTVQNTNNQMQKNDETGRYAGIGEYIVTFLSLDNRAADVDDGLEITVNTRDGKPLMQAHHTLTPTEIQESFVQIDLTLPPSSPPWDVNADGVVNIFDLVFVSSQFGKPNADPKADVNRDGVVNIFDLVLVAAHFGERTDGVGQP
jgi:hypothetical protein